MSTQTELSRQLLKKQLELENRNTPKHLTIGKNMKIPCFAHYSSIRQNTITTNASSKGQGQHSGTSKKREAFNRWRLKTDLYRIQKYAINELRLLAVVEELKHFSLYIYGKPSNLSTDHQALEPQNKRKPSNKTYSARLTRWLDRLSHFTINAKHIAGKHSALTNNLRRNSHIRAIAER